MAEYLSAFDTEWDYQKASIQCSFARPNVSLCKQEEEVHYTLLTSGATVNSVTVDGAATTYATNFYLLASSGSTSASGCQIGVNLYTGADWNRNTDTAATHTIIISGQGFQPNIYQYEKCIMRGDPPYNYLCTYSIESVTATEQTITIVVNMSKDFFVTTAYYYFASIKIVGAGEDGKDLYIAIKHPSSGPI